MNDELQRMREDREQLLQELTEAGAEVKYGGRTVKCPFHEDHNPSGSVYEKNGIWRFQCHTTACGFCGDFLDVRAKSRGVPVEGLLKALSPQRHETTRTPSAQI